MERFNNDERVIVPIWRDINRTFLSRELNNSSLAKVKNDHKDVSSILLKQNFADWRNNKTLPFAADLVSAAYTLGLQNEVTDAIIYIIENEKNKSSSLYKFSEKLLKEIHGKAIEDENITPLNENDRIHYHRNVLKDDLNNPLDWIEMARLYACQGRYNKANRYVKGALQLSRNNRYILRSAASFFYHRDDIDRAHSLIKKSENVRKDPWLLSIEISLSDVLGRTSQLIRIGEKLTQDKNLSNFEVSELNSSLATFLFNKGEFKNARKYFNKAMVDPHENSINQAIVYGGKNFEITIEQKHLTSLKFPFETNALSAFNEKNYQRAVDYSHDWQKDQPFSLRPTILGSYTASIFLQNHDSSIKILKTGLKNHPGNVSLLNNLLYDLIMLNKISEAEDIIKSLNDATIEKEDDETKICLQATLGLYYFRINNFELGRQLYLKSIDNARIIKSDVLKALATANYVREEILAESTEIENAFELLQKNCYNRTESDVKILVERATNLYKKWKN